MTLAVQGVLSALALGMLLAAEAAAQQIPTPDTAKPSPTPEMQVFSERTSNERIVVTARRLGGVPPADPAGDFIKSMYAACAYDDGGRRIDWKRQAKAGEACAVIFFGIDYETAQGAPVYLPKWLLGIEGSPEGDPNEWKIVIVGPNDEFRIHKVSVQSAIQAFRRTEEQEKARGFGFALTGVLTHHYSYRTVLWRSYCENRSISSLNGCGAGYDPALFYYRSFVRDRYPVREPDFTPPY